MKNLFFIGLTIINALVFASCSDIKDADNYINNNTGNSKKLVSTITYENTNDPNKTVGVELFYDNDNRVIRIEKSGQPVTTFEYNGNTVTARHTEETNTYTVTATLDGNGYVISEESVNNADPTDKTTVSVTYSDGYLQKIKDGYETIVTTWQSGNMISETIKTVSEPDEVYNYNYSKSANLANIDFNFIIADYNYDLCKLDWGALGMLGKKSLNLCSSDSDGETTFQYEANLSGYISKITVYNGPQELGAFYITYTR